MYNDKTDTQKETPSYYKDRQFHDKNIKIRKDFGNQLRQLRKQHGYSQEAFS